MAEAVSGIGLMVGPVVGGLFYSFFGYFATFFVFGMLLTLNLVISKLITPDVLNKSTDDDIDEEKMKKIQKRINFKTFLTNRRTMIAFTACVIVCISISY